MRTRVAAPFLATMFMAATLLIGCVPQPTDGTTDDALSSDTTDEAVETQAPEATASPDEGDSTQPAEVSKTDATPETAEEGVISCEDSLQIRPGKWPRVMDDGTVIEDLTANVSLEGGKLVVQFDNTIGFLVEFDLCSSPLQACEGNFCIETTFTMNTMASLFFLDQALQREVYYASPM
ncbi:MAG TPA: hypothetical protein DEB09_01880 [Candidatus Magasanikbacteria bacterium]|nr:hypothetical protein [Candidatus Magasanikbacteria bacterium]